MPGGSRSGTTKREAVEAMLDPCCEAGPSMQVVASPTQHLPQPHLIKFFWSQKQQQQKQNKKPFLAYFTTSAITTTSNDNNTS